MRVISGRAKGHKLKRVPGDTTRPIMDRVKESLFDILGDAVGDARWLDLFAGTGQVGIEALSRGAGTVVFLDNARLAVHTIQDNLRLTGLHSSAQVFHIDAFKYLRDYEAGPFDLIYVAPPQYRQLWLEALTLIDARAECCLAPNGLVVAQIHPREYFDLPLNHLTLTDQRRYGATLLCFYQRTDELSDEAQRVNDEG